MSPVSGYLDSNVVIHALLMNDARSRECASYMEALGAGRASAILDTAVVHELTYSLQRVPPGFNRERVARPVAVYSATVSGTF